MQTCLRWGRGHARHPRPISRLFPSCTPLAAKGIKPWDQSPSPDNSAAAGYNTPPNSGMPPWRCATHSVNPRRSSPAGVWRLGARLEASPVPPSFVSVARGAKPKSFRPKGSTSWRPSATTLSGSTPRTSRALGSSTGVRLRRAPVWSPRRFRARQPVSSPLRRCAWRGHLLSAPSAPCMGWRPSSVPSTGAWPP